MKSSGRSEPNGVPQVAIQGPALLNLLINDEDDGADCTLSKFADETNLGVMADKPGARALMREGLGQAGEMNRMKFNRGKCKVLTENSNTWYQYTVVLQRGSLQHA